MAAFNALQHPVHVFDIVHKRMFWANHAAVQLLWHAPDLPSLLARDFATDMSEATERRLHDYLRRFANGESLIRDQWTYYPQNAKDQVTVHLSLSPIWIIDASSERNHGSTEPYMALLNEADLASLLQHDAVNPACLRGVEMLRHLPVAVSQFDIAGQTVMDQNPEALNLFGGLEDLLLSCQRQNEELLQSSSSSSSLEFPLEPDDEEDEDNDENDVEILEQPDGCGRKGSQDSASDDSSATHKINPATTATPTRKATLAANNAFVGRFVDRALGRKVLQAVQRGDDYQVEAQQYIINRQPRVKNTNHKNRNSNGSSQAASASTAAAASSAAAWSTCWFAIKVRRSRDPVTQQAVILYSARDITEVIQAKNHADQANMEKSQLLAVLAHEIRTPLHQVVGFIDLLLAGRHPSSCGGDGGKRTRQRNNQTSNNNNDSWHHEESSASLSEEQLEFVQSLQASSVSLMTIINDILDYTKLEAGQMEMEEIPFDPRGVCEGCVEVVRSNAEKKGLSIYLHYDNPEDSDKSGSEENRKKSDPEAIGDEKEPVPHVPIAKFDYSMASSLTTSSTTTTSGASATRLPNCVLGDPNRIRQILLNLLSNAVKFTQHGSVTLTLRCTSQIVAVGTKIKNKKNATRRSPTKQPHVQPPPQHQVLEFRVTDTGVGIGQDYIDRIFKSYTQADVASAVAGGGTGLGLTICKILAEAMHGSLTVQSQVNVGSTFTLRIPVPVDTGLLHVVKMEQDSDCASLISTSCSAMLLSSCNQQDNSTLDSVGALPDASGSTTTIATTMSSESYHEHQEHENEQERLPLRILVVEDNKMNQKLIKAMVARANVHDVVTIVDNGQLALDELRRRTPLGPAAAPCYYDVVFMDVQMPVLNGLEATHQIRTVLGWGKEDLTIIGLTASFQSADWHRYLEVGMNDCFGKPVRFHVLQNALECVRQQRIDEREEQQQQ
ncbi:hypothetical protein ACA910_003685 [Epithemia clementina (nom. ined.)]